MREEVAELTSLAVLDEDEVWLAMQLMPTDDDNYAAQENVPEIKNQGEVVYNEDWVFGGSFQWHLADTRNHNPLFASTHTSS